MQQIANAQAAGPSPSSHISLWILQVVLKFWRYLSAVDPARARVLASPRRRHAASQAAHNERAVRRLESGASD